MGIRSRLNERNRERRRAWSQQVLDVATDMIAVDANTELLSAVVDSRAECVRIVYRSRWWPRVLGYRGYVPAPIRRDSVQEFAEALSRLSVCEPLGNQADVLTIDGGIEWWGDGYPTLALSPDVSSDTRGRRSTAVSDDDAAWARWRARHLTPQTVTAPAEWLAASTHAVAAGYPARVRLSPPEAVGTGQEFGDLPTGVLDQVCAILARHTITGEQCWFGVGRTSVDQRQPERVRPVPACGTEGSASTETRTAVDDPARAAGRDGRAAVRALRWARHCCPSDGLEPTPAWFWREWPNLIWPADHAWIAECGIDDVVLDISGTSALIADLDTVTGGFHLERLR